MDGDNNPTPAPPAAPMPDGGATPPAAPMPNGGDEPNQGGGMGGSEGGAPAEGGSTPPATPPTQM